MSMGNSPTINREKVHTQMKTQNVSAELVMSTMSPQSLAALESHYKGQLISGLQELTKKLAGPTIDGPDADPTDAPAKKRSGGRPKGSKNKVKDTDTTVEAPAKKRGPKAKAATRGAKPGKRQLDSKGRTAAEVIREYDAKHVDAKANDVVAYCHKLGLTNVVPANIYNTRQLVRKAAEAEAKVSRSCPAGFN